MPTPAREAVQRLKLLADSALGEVRSVSHLLYPPDWQMLTTAQALRRLLTELGATACFPEASIQIQELPVEPHHSIKVALYRCAQECIGNVIRHSGATRLDVFLTAVGDVVELKVIDNGVGFDYSAQLGRGLGLAALQTYASTSHGTCTVISGKGGTTITFRVPQSSN